MKVTPEIEAVARAIYEGRNGSGSAPFKVIPKKHREPYILDAFAAVRALKYATPGQKDAGGTAIDIHYSICECVEFPEDVAECAYRHMIDAALGGNK